MRRTYKLSILFYAVVLAVVTIMAFNVKRSVNLFYLNKECPFLYPIHPIYRRVPLYMKAS